MKLRSCSILTEQLQFYNAITLERYIGYLAISWPLNSVALQGIATWTEVVTPQKSFKLYTSKKTADIHIFFKVK